MDKLIEKLLKTTDHWAVAFRSAGLSQKCRRPAAQVISSIMVLFLSSLTQVQDDVSINPTKTLIASTLTPTINRKHRTQVADNNRE